MSDKFEWTDELVKEFASKLLVDRIAWAASHDCAAAPKPIPLYLQEFKEEKTHKEWEIAKVRNKYHNTHITHNLVEIDGRKYINDQNYDYVLNCLEHKYTIEAVRRLSDGEVFSVGEQVYMGSVEPMKIKRFVNIGGSIYAVLENDTAIWQESLNKLSKPAKVAKEWEIMSSDNTPAILSVKRLSDGEVFSVGDEVEHFTGDYRDKIFGFTGLLNYGWFYFDEAKKNVKDLRNFKKVKPKPLLVKTEDGVEIYDEETVVYRVWPKEHWNQQSYTAKFYNPHPVWKTFSCKEAADEYILNNKPLLSVNEVFEIARNSFPDQMYFLRNINGLAQSKLSK